MLQISVQSDSRQSGASVSCFPTKPVGVELFADKACLACCLFVPSGESLDMRMLVVSVAHRFMRIVCHIAHGSMWLISSRHSCARTNAHDSTARSETSIP